MKSFLQVILLLISVKAQALNQSFAREKSLDFVSNSALIEARKIQYYSSFLSLDKVRENPEIQKRDKRGQLQKSYGQSSGVLVFREIFLIEAPLSEFERAVYARPQMQKKFFKNIQFSDCNTLNCRATQKVYGLNVHYIAHYDFHKQEPESFYEMDQAGEDWSLGFENSFSSTQMSSYNDHQTLVEAYQVVILKSGMDKLRDKVTEVIKQSLLDFNSCFATQSCQKYELK
jgi:hypothetical protein